MAYIEWKNIEKYYETNYVLRNIEGGIEKGELVTLLGPSGCGKSTLLRCLSGLEQVSSGRILLAGTDITNLPPQKRHMGMVFQQYNLFPNMNVEQNVGFPLKMAKLPGKRIKVMVNEMLERVGLLGYAGYYPGELSGGQQQRVALARAMVLEPKVLLLDEPLSAIDALLRRKLQTEIRRIQRESGITTIFVTHDQSEAMVMSDRIFLMNGGRIEQWGRPDELYTNPGNRFAAGFMGNYNILPGEVFGRLTGKPVNGASVAIRPEVIKVSLCPAEGYGFQLRGTLKYKELHGTILRLHLMCDDFLLHADLLYDKSCAPEENQELFLLIKEEDCLMLPD